VSAALAGLNSLTSLKRPLIGPPRLFASNTDQFQSVQFGKAFTKAEYDAVVADVRQIKNRLGFYKNKISDPNITSIQIDPTIYHSKAYQQLLRNGILKDNKPETFEAYARAQMLRAFDEAVMGSRSDKNIISEYPTGAAAQVIIEQGRQSAVLDINQFNLTTIDEINRCSERQVMDEARRQRMRWSPNTNKVNADILSMALMPMRFATLPDLKSHSPCFPCFQEMSADLKDTSQDSVLRPDTILFSLMRVAANQDKVSKADHFVIKALPLQNLLPMENQINGQFSYFNSCDPAEMPTWQGISIKPYSPNVQQTITDNWGSNNAFETDLKKLFNETYHHYLNDYSRYPHKSTAGILFKVEDKGTPYISHERSFFGTRFFVQGFWSVEPITVAAIQALDYFNNHAVEPILPDEQRPLKGAKLVVIWTEKDSKAPTPQDIYNLKRLSGNEKLLIATVNGGKSGDLSPPTIEVYQFNERFPHRFIEQVLHS